MIPGQKQKRGRKPKGAKINTNNIVIDTNLNKPTNKKIILHLKCKVEDTCINYKNMLNIESNNEPFNLLTTTDSYTEIKNRTICECQNNRTEKEKEKDKDIINNKLSELEKNLHNNDINQNSNCFWCTYSFDTIQISIPMNKSQGKYNSYGCFCSPECAASYLFKENIDESVKHERYQLLNYIYGKIYNYEKAIKLAPSPYYFLDKYCGNLSIQEYRSLLKYQRLFIVTEKPLAKIYPEIHEDSSNFEPMYNNKTNMKPLTPEEYKKNNKLSIFN